MFRLVARRGVRTVSLAATAALASFVLAASVCFACTDIMGPLTITPDSGHAGSAVYTSATGLKPYPARYNVYFGGACMTFTGKLLKVITTDMNGAWTHVKMIIPSKAAPGFYSLCGTESYPIRGGSATSHSAFTVV